MLKNLQKYQKDLNALLNDGNELILAMQWECYPENVEVALKKALKTAKAVKERTKKLPSFIDEYQIWYSESKSLIKLLLPDRLDDFVRHYQIPKPRKDVSYDTYKIEDYLQGLNVTRGWEKTKVVGPEAAIPQFRQQLAILKSVKKRFESSLFDIQQIVQADLFDSELDAATELNKKGFGRAAGAIAGVVLEKHLAQICANHGIKFRKRNLTISDFNDELKKGEVIDVPQWRSIQHLGDIRNLCDHNKNAEPTKEQVTELIAGVGKVAKLLF